MKSHQLKTESKELFKAGMLVKAQRTLIKAAGQKLIEIADNDVIDLPGVGLALHWLHEIFVDNNLKQSANLFSDNMFEYAAERARFYAIDPISLEGNFSLDGNFISAGVAYGCPIESEVEIPTEFSVEIISYENKIQLIRTLREIFGKSLKETKDMVEAVPIKIAYRLPKYEATDIAKKLSKDGTAKTVVVPDSSYIY